MDDAPHLEILVICIVANSSGNVGHGIDTNDTLQGKIGLKR